MGNVPFQPNVYSAQAAVNNNSTSATAVSFGIDVTHLRIEAPTSISVFFTVGGCGTCANVASTASAFIAACHWMEMVDLPRLSMASLTTTSTAVQYISIFGAGGY